MEQGIELNRDVILDYWHGRIFTDELLQRIGAKVVGHGRYVTFQMAEVAVSRQMFQEILTLIARLRTPPAPA